MRGTFYIFKIRSDRRTDEELEKEKEDEEDEQNGRAIPPRTISSSSK